MASVMNQNDSLNTELILRHSNQSINQPNHPPTGDAQSGKGLLRRIPPVNIEEAIVDATYPTRVEYKVMNPGASPLGLLGIKRAKHPR